LLLPLVLSIIPLLQATSANSSSSTAGLYKCQECQSSNPRCRDFCYGLRCYRSELTIGKTRTMKTGCYNRTFGALGCETFNEQSPGVLENMFEQLCECEGDYCNVSSLSSVLLAPLSILLLHLLTTV
ncbi:hypothetical protein PFISCL1PPCAC_25411, partial [Pristionchus fissidentatus]